MRYPEQLKGTRIDCREGDCGACIVLVGELNIDGQTVNYQNCSITHLSPIFSVPCHWPCFAECYPWQIPP